jgi:hypothetical protein
MGMISIRTFWMRFWMHFAGSSGVGGVATNFAICFIAPYKSLCHLAGLNSRGYVSPDER